jgi:hypothetical protein
MGIWLESTAFSLPPFSHAGSVVPERVIRAFEPSTPNPHCGTSRRSPPRGILFRGVRRWRKRRGSPPARPFCGWWPVQRSSTVHGGSASQTIDFPVTELDAMAGSSELDFGRVGHAARPSHQTPGSSFTPRPATAGGDPGASCGLWRPGVRDTRKVSLSSIFGVFTAGRWNGGNTVFCGASAFPCLPLSSPVPAHGKMTVMRRRRFQEHARQISAPRRELLVTGSPQP